MQPLTNASYFSRPQLYGGFGGFAQKGEAPTFVARSQRQRLNIIPIMQCLFLPWILYCLVYAALTFSLHYSNPTLCYMLVACAFLAVLVCGGLAVGKTLKRMRGDAVQANWIIFLSISMLIAWVLAVVLGDLNFATHMQPYYDYTNLNEYYYVDPSQMRGQQLMDVGKAYFVNGTGLDLKRSMGFKNLDTYCVAPITMNGLPLASYDFWAVGLDCCSGNMADFQCGEYNNRNAQGGLRLLRDDERAFFRLAVQQAEATYSIKATHPLFFYWTQDPQAEMESFRDQGVRFYLIGMMAHFAWQIFAVLLAVASFTKLDQL